MILTGFTVAMVTYFVLKMTIIGLPMAGHLYMWYQYCSITW